jgi:excisionase family DNA binding protein
MDRIFHGKRETAATLGISVRTLENLVAIREITPRRVGRRVLFETREIERFARRDHRTKQERKGNEDASENSQLLSQQ